MVEFIVPGDPQGKARARVTKLGSYTPENTVLYENYIRLCYTKETDVKSFNPLSVTIEAYFEPKKSNSKRNRAEMLLGLIFPTKKPDIDNIAKVILDALNGIAYKDDTQVVRLFVSKDYAKNSRVKVTIKDLVTDN